MPYLVYSAVLVVSMLTLCTCSGSIGAIHKRIRNFNKKLNKFKVELVDMDTNLHESIEIAKNSLRQEITEHFKQQIQDAKEEFHRDESAPNVVRAHIDSQVQRLKKGQQDMKRQLQRVMESLRHVQQEKDLYRDAFFKADRRIAELCYKCTSDSNVLKKDNETLQSGNKLFDKQRFNLINDSPQMNSTHKEEVEELLKATTSLNRSTTTTTTNSPVSTRTTTVYPSTTTVSLQQTPIMNRLLIASERESEIVQLDIHSRRSTKYSLHVPHGVLALCYIQRLRKLLMGTVTQKITSTSLDGDDTQILREGVWVTGMAVDERRELVFMSTWQPGYSISNMSTRGDNFTIIRNLTGGYSLPDSIAVNARKREVYVGSYTKRTVFSLSYDGKVLKTLVSAYDVDITFDCVRNTLYFNDGNTLKTISDGVVSNVTSLNVVPYTLAYYNNTVYYGGWDYSHFVAVVRLGENVAETRLKTTSSKYFNGINICLVP